MTAQPLVSIIIPCYNHAEYLTFCINSILNQSFKNFEIIIINDASTDDSLKVAESFKDKRIRIFNNEKNRGCIQSGNIGFREARGKYINLFSSDDGMLPKNLEKKIKILEINPGIGGVFSEAKIIDEESKEIVDTNFRKKLDYTGAYDYLDFLHYGSFIITHSMLIKKDVFNTHWVQNEKFPLAAEWGMQLNLCKNNKIAYIKEPLVYFRMHKKNMSKSIDTLKFKKDSLEMIKMHIKKYPSVKAKRLLLGNLYYSLCRSYYNKKDFKNAIKYLSLSLFCSSCFFAHIINHIR